ncbi:hypothetical protein FACS189443_6840 [Planctomycetales bacterium]|nr:hypothetical protein FACS189443_6840 [Planctomycetales bacterium]
MIAAFYLRVSGLKLREIADTMGIGLRTVVKYLRCAKDATIEAIEKGKKTADNRRQ